MSLRAPRLDDRRFDELVAEAKTLIQRKCPQWTDLSWGDPGMTLVELFAHLTEVLLYRLNRVPERVHVELLRLLGVSLRPPAAARVELSFQRSGSAQNPLAIPEGTRVGVGRGSTDGPAPVFVTAAPAELAAGADEVLVPALCCELVAAELAGLTSGGHGQSVRVRRPPIVARLEDGSDLVVGVEMHPEDGLGERATAISHAGKSYRICREVDAFHLAESDDPVYVVDRSTGTISFAPTVRNADSAELKLGAAPPPGRELRLWYRRGGGAAGNVAPGTLTTMKDALPGLAVTNRGPATGGRDLETLENAIRRGPLEFRSLERALTAEDFEHLALRASGAIARAKASTQAGVWAHARPGTVEVLLVPALAPESIQAGRVRAAMLSDRQTDQDRTAVERELERRRPLGTTLITSWARYKTVRVRARVVTFREADPEAVRRALIERLERTINPVSTGAGHAGWSFGQPLRVFTVFDIARSEPGVRYAEDVRLVVDDVPDAQVSALAADAHQARTWYAACGPALHRSSNDGEGWELLARFEDEHVVTIESDRARSGLVAVATRAQGGEASSIHVSRDCGETFERVARTAFRINDIAFMRRAERSLLWLATDRGLYELELNAGAAPLQVLVDPKDHDLGFTHVAVSSYAQGGVHVAVAAQQDKGVFLSTHAGTNDTFRSIGLEGTAVAALVVQTEGLRAFLWAGAAAEGGAEGLGARRFELRRSESAVEEWSEYFPGWHGGSCRRLALAGPYVLAGSHRAGVLRLDSSEERASWRSVGIESGLPLRDQGRLHPIDALAAHPERNLALSGGPAGVHRSTDGGETYACCTRAEQDAAVTIPHGWLFCSGDHELSVVREGDSATPSAEEDR